MELLRSSFPRDVQSRTKVKNPAYGAISDANASHCFFFSERWGKEHKYPECMPHQMAPHVNKQHEYHFLLMSPSELALLLFFWKISRAWNTSAGWCDLIHKNLSADQTKVLGLEMPLRKRGQGKVGTGESFEVIVAENDAVAGGGCRAFFLQGKENIHPEDSYCLWTMTFGWKVLKNLCLNFFLVDISDSFVWFFSGCHWGSILPCPVLIKGLCTTVLTLQAYQCFHINFLK